VIWQPGGGIAQKILKLLAMGDGKEHEKSNVTRILGSKLRYLQRSSGQGTPNAEGNSMISRARAVQIFAVAAVLMIARLAVDFTMAAVGRRLPRHAGCLTVIGALFLCLAVVPIVHADSTSCLAKASSYVAELDQLLSNERSWITPFMDLNARYFPLRDCETDALLDVVRGSSFIRSISHGSRGKAYFIYFSSDEVSVGFGYLVSEKKSTFASAIWVNK
jgi:hypothetical protein